MTAATTGALSSGLTLKTRITAGLLAFALGSALAAFAGILNGLYYNEINFGVGGSCSSAPSQLAAKLVGSEDSAPERCVGRLWSMRFSE